ncbi:DUF362 domain-containing protein [Treponema primitia]|uniref:DUF362 domain-containing protein n=1 Tax=Treponema primitia TaxID=88058 RepID=UPI00397F4B15
MEKNEILVNYGEKIDDMAYALAEAANLADLIGPRERRIGLKPNLVVPRPAEEGATTHPEIARGLIRYLQKNGFRNILILEGSWVGARTEDAFPRCGYTALASDLGVELLDTKTDKAHSYDCKGMEIEICDSAMAVDFMINLPVMKGHCQTLLTCALKNNKGIMPDREKRRFHTLGLDKPIAHLNTKVKNDFILVDGICGDLDFEEGGNPVYSGKLYAARDPVLCDAWTATQMGYRVEEIPYIGLAEKLGVGCADPAKAVIREISPPLPGKAPVPSGKVRQFTSYIKEDRSCSACYANLIFALSRLERAELNRLKEKVCIGQGFQDKPGKLGVGRCTASFSASLKGCPPAGADIITFLREN